MAQFDVHRNTGKNQEAIPFAVLAQPAIFDSYRRRVVVPLVRKSSLGAISDERFNPIFKIERIEVVLHPLEIVSIPNEKLGEFVKSFAKEGSRITDALDVLLSRARRAGPDKPHNASTIDPEYGHCTGTTGL